MSLPTSLAVTIYDSSLGLSPLQGSEGVIVTSLSPAPNAGLGTDKMPCEAGLWGKGVLRRREHGGISMGGIVTGISEATWRVSGPL